MISVIPAILPKSFEEIERKVARVRGHASWIQIDLCDGIFVENKTWPYAQGGLSLFQTIELPFWKDVSYEFDLMVAHPEKIIEDISNAGGSRIILHIESAEEAELLQAVREAEHLDLEVYLALSNDTPLEKLYALLEKEQYVHGIQLMGIKEIGKQGEPFDERVLPRLKEISLKYPSFIRSIDGAVTTETAKALVEAGAHSLVSGSGIFESGDTIGTIELLRNLG